MLSAPRIWLNRLTIAAFALALGFTFCGLFLVPEGKKILSNLLVAAIAIGLANLAATGRQHVGLPDRRILWVFLGYGLFIFFNRLVHGDQYGVMRNIGYVVLFGLLIPRDKIILVISRYAIQLGGMGLGLLSIWQVYHGVGRVEGFTNAILFSQASLGLALLSWFVGYERADVRWGKIISAVTIVMSLYALYASQSRGVWLALISILSMIIVIKARRKPFKYMCVFVGVVLAFALFYQQSTVLQARAKSSFSDIQHAERGAYDTSWGLRIVAWQGAWQGFLTAPVLGVGTEGFDAIKQQLVREGKISPLLLHPALAHCHNQFMQNLMIRGAIGLVALLLFLGLPMLWGKKLAGVTSVLMLYPVVFAVSGLSDVPFEHQNIIYLYTLGLLFLWLDFTVNKKVNVTL